MTARSTYQEEIERRQAEQGERFLKQLGDMFQATRTDLAAQFIPRQEAETRFDHLEQVVERIGTAMEKLTNNTSNFHESAPRIFADRADTKADIAELRTEIEKLKTAREADKEKQYGYRVDDLGRVYKGDAGTERGWRTNAQQQGNQLIGWIIGISLALFTIAINIIVVLAMR